MAATLSGIVLLAYVVCIVTRVAMMRRRGIRAVTHAPFDRSDVGLPAFLIILIYAVLAKPLGLPMWDPLVQTLWKSNVIGWVGLGLSVLALVGFIFTLVSFGDSLRIGIEDKSPPALITGGMFALTRNPIYLCFLTLLLGLVLVHRNILMIAAAVFFAAMIHRQILKEEAFCKKNYGEEYEDYCEKVRRYI